jgi:hypothetical protein
MEENESFKQRAGVAILDRRYVNCSKVGVKQAKKTLGITAGWTTRIGSQS